jgi:DNA-binding SARP family transcriptional activator
MARSRWRCTPVLVSPGLLEFRLLGPFEVRRDGVVLDLGGPRRAAFLAALAMSPGRVVTADRLVNDIWGEQPPRTAGHGLQVLASETRKLLPPGTVSHRPSGYVLDVPPDAVDVYVFEHLLSGGGGGGARGDHTRAVGLLADALALWRGEMLADLAGLDFAESAARRAGELRTVAQELQLEARLAQGDAAGVVPVLRDLARSEPLREKLHALLMQALAADGRRAEALTVYAEIRRRLDEELGIAPGAELRDIHRSVVSDPADDEPQPAPPGAVRSGSVMAIGYDTETLAAVVSTAAPAAAASGRELLVACVIPRDGHEVPDLDRASADARGAAGAGVRSAAFTIRDPAADIGAFADEHDADLVVLPAESLTPGPFPPALADLLRRITADVALVAGSPQPASTGVAALFGGGEHDWAAIELAALIARAGGTSLRLIGAATADRDASRLVAGASLAVQHVVGIVVEQVLASPGAPAILQAAAARTLVLGVSDRWRSQGLGDVRLALADAPPGAVIVRRGARPGLLAPAEARTRFTWSIAAS